MAASPILKRLLSSTVAINRSGASAPARLTSLRTELHHNLHATELGYLYTYPTKQSFNASSDVKGALDAWRGYKGHINLYTHIPFCAQKCGFCNLYTVTLGDRDVRAAAAATSPTPVPSVLSSASAAVSSLAASPAAPVWKFNQSSPTDVSRYAAAILKEFDIFRGVMDQRNVSYGTCLYDALSHHLCTHCGLFVLCLCYLPLFEQIPFILVAVHQHSCKQLFVYCY
jgi:hypothetical protein